MEIVNTNAYQFNGYMNGQCPTCREWEAPITQNELSHMVDEYAHHGSGEKEVDDSAFYRREVWKEFFQCPKCKARYSVEYSNT